MRFSPRGLCKRDKCATVFVFRKNVTLFSTNPTSRLCSDFSSERLHTYLVYVRLYIYISLCLNDKIPSTIFWENEKERNCDIIHYFIFSSSVYNSTVSTVFWRPTKRNKKVKIKYTTRSILKLNTCADIKRVKRYNRIKAEKLYFFRVIYRLAVRDDVFKHRKS